MRVGVLGVNHKLAGLELRELLAKICSRRLHPSQSTHGEHSLILLSTCNRTEIYFSSEDLAETHSYLLNVLRQDISEDFDQKLYSYFGQDCLHHLCRVTAGLDSAIVAETEIQGQVKNAYETAQEYHKIRFDLHYLFQKSLGIAKKVRAVLPTRPGLPDIGQAILQTGQHLFKSPVDQKILFVGASDINENILMFLKGKQLQQISLCNRSYDTGKKTAEKLGVEFVQWNEISSWHRYDWIIFGTKSPDILLDNHMIPEGLKNRKLVIDLSVPRNVSPSVGKHKQVTLLNIDQLNRRLKVRRKHLSNTLLLAEDLINKTTGVQMHLFQEKEKNRLRLCAISA